MSDLALTPRNGLALAERPAPPPAARQFAFEEVVKMARSVAKSGLFPGITTDEQALTLMMLCESEGLHPMQALRRYHVIKGRPSMRADAMQAEFQRQGGVIRWERSDAEECTARFVHPVHAPEPGVTIGLTMARAEAYGLTGNDLYRKYPDQMLRARVISQGVRMVLPGVVVGIYTPEEADSFAEEAPASPRPALGAPATIHAGTPGPGPELDSRSAVNEAFRGGAKDDDTDTDEPARDPRSRESTPLWGDRVGARGLDVRKWADVQDGAVLAVRTRLNRYRVDEMGLMPIEDKDRPNQFSMLNHMVTATVGAGAEDPNPNAPEADGKRKAIGNGKKADHLHRLYLDPRWREWMREEARDYLARKLREGVELARTEAGMVDPPGPGPEAEAGGPPEGEPEGEPEAGAEAGWRAGRE